MTLFRCVPANVCRLSPWLISHINHLVPGLSERGYSVKHKEHLRSFRRLHAEPLSGWEQTDSALRETLSEDQGPASVASFGVSIGDGGESPGDHKKTKESPAH